MKELKVDFKEEFWIQNKDAYDETDLMNSVLEELGVLEVERQIHQNEKQEEIKKEITVSKVLEDAKLEDLESALDDLL